MDDSHDVEENVDVDFTQFKGTKRKYFELKLKMVMRHFPSLI